MDRMKEGKPPIPSVSWFELRIYNSLKKRKYSRLQPKIEGLPGSNSASTVGLLQAGVYDNS